MIISVLVVFYYFSVTIVKNSLIDANSSEYV